MTYIVSSGALNSTPTNQPYQFVDVLLQSYKVAMKSSAVSVLVVVVMAAACFAVVCQSAAVSKQRPAADAAAAAAAGGGGGGGGISSWLTGLMTNRRRFIPPVNRHTETIRIQTVRE